MSGTIRTVRSPGMQRLGRDSYPGPSISKGSFLMTRASMAGLVAMLVGILLFLAPAQAAEVKGPQPHVVIVGISDYADKQINPRPRAEDDAKALYDLFTNKAYLN